MEQTGIVWGSAAADMFSASTNFHVFPSETSALVGSTSGSTLWPGS
jgi:hypothetical protein